MATQEERITTLEQTFAIFRKETTARTQEIEENTTIMLGVMRAQGQDIRRIFERLNTIEERFDRVEQHLNRMETKFDEHATLLNEILTRLPKNP